MNFEHEAFRTMWYNYFPYNEMTNADFKVLSYYRVQFIIVLIEPTYTDYSLNWSVAKSTPMYYFLLYTISASNEASFHVL